MFYSDPLSRFPADFSVKAVHTNIMNPCIALKNLWLCAVHALSLENAVNENIPFSRADNFEKFQSFFLS